jgi:uncharacterized delta-60 repeat protein
MRNLQVFAGAAVVAVGILTIPLMAGAAAISGSPSTSDWAPAAFAVPAPLAVALSATGPDQLQSAAAGPNGTFYAAGFAAASLTGPRNVVVVKLTKTGRPDRSFGGGDGIAKTALEFRGGNDEIAIGVQPSGKIVISAVIANAAVPADRDIAVARLKPSGMIDRTFADHGVRVLDFNSAIVSGATATGADAARALVLDATGRIYIIGLQRGEGQFNGAPRTDTDFVITRLSKNGNVDRSFGTGGKHLLDIRGTDANRTPSSATPHSVKVLADGSVIGGGYAATAGIAGSAQPVVYKLDTRGKLVKAFADKGVFHAAVLSLQTEVYGMALHRTHVVTGGYGRDSGAQNDWVSLRFNLATGKRDPTWGGAAKGGVTIDPSGKKVGDNCRNAFALPGGKTVLVGSTGPGGQPAQDAAFAVLDAKGRLDTAYGTGVHVYALGGGAGGNDQFWSGVASGSNAIIVGYRGGGAAQTEATNDDSYAVILPLLPSLKR